MNSQIYKASDFEIKTLQSVRFWNKLLQRVRFRFKLLFIKSALGKKALKKSRFDFFNPVKMRLFAICAPFKMDDSLGFFLYQILKYNFYSLSDFEIESFCLVIFGIKFFSLGWKLKQVLFNVLNLEKETFGFRREVLPKSKTKMFCNVFPHNTNSSQSLRNPHSRDNSSRRSNKNLCTHFHTDIYCCFHSVVSRFPQYELYLCSNWLPLIVLQKLKLSFSHTNVTILEKSCNVDETFWWSFTPTTNTHTINLFKQIPITKFQHIFKPCPRKTTSEQPRRLSGTLKHWSCWRRILLVFLFIQNNGWSSFSHLQVVQSCSWKKNIYPWSKRQHPTPREDITRRTQNPPSLIAHNRWSPYLELQQWQKHPSSSQIFLVALEWLGFGPTDCSKILVSGTTISSKLAKEIFLELKAFLGQYILTSKKQNLDQGREITGFLRFKLRRNAAWMCVKIA